MNLRREHNSQLIANLRQSQNRTGKIFHGILSWYDLETCSKVAEDSAVGQNTYDFLLVFYSNFDRISYRFCPTVDFMPK